MKLLKDKSIVYSICVSGAAAGPTVKQDALLAGRLGEEIAKKGQIVLSGATVGLPYYAAKAAFKAGGGSIGFSPAVSLREHLRKYRLPIDCFDFINYTGMNYVGRDLYLVQSSDAVITIGGRFGSLHEFTSALEAKKPCGVLLGSGGTADIIPELISKLDPSIQSLIVYSNSPEELVDKMIKLLEESTKDIRDQLNKHDEFWYLEEPWEHKKRG